MTTTIYLAHDYYDAEHLDDVKAQMLELGSPTIRVIDDGAAYWAVEGCHRLRAAEDLGIKVNLMVIIPDEPIDHTSIDLDTCGWFDEDVVMGRDYIAWYFKDPIFGRDSVEVEVA